jgi:hypothetical protein
MKTPTHEDVAQRAHQLWQDSGCPGGRDTEIWLEAERQLTAGSAEDSAEATANPATSPSSSPMPNAEAAKAARQKQAARAPILPGKSAPKFPPAETGKPLWSQPHSS